jgi:allophanate hydrolase subunit 1
MVDYRVLTAGDTAIVIEFGDSIDRRLNAIVLALARRLDESHIRGLNETIPTFRSLTVVSQGEYEVLAAKAAAGALDLEPEQEATNPG